MVAVAIGAAAVVGGVTSVISGNKAANAAKDASTAANDVQRYMYDQTRADYAPWRNTGTAALGKLAKLYGVSPQGGGVAGNFGGYPAQNSMGYSSYGDIAGMDSGSTSLSPYAYQRLTDQGLLNQTTPANDNTGAPDDRFKDFYDSPDYQFRLSEGMKAIERSASASGKLRSGATMKSIGNYAQGVASSEYGNNVNRLASLAGIGQSATDSSAQAGQNFANQTGNNLINAGNARASAYANTGSAINGTVSNLAGAYLYTKGYGG